MAVSAQKVGQRCVEAGERETKAFLKETAWDSPLAVKDQGSLFAQKSAQGEGRRGQPVGPAQLASDRSAEVAIGDRFRGDQVVHPGGLGFAQDEAYGSDHILLVNPGHPLTPAA
jgi:hypothetical protein